MQTRCHNRLLVAFHPGDHRGNEVIAFKHQVRQWRNDVYDYRHPQHVELKVVHTGYYIAQPFARPAGQRSIKQHVVIAEQPGYGLSDKQTQQ